MSKQMQISIKQISDICYPMDTPEKVIVFREYVKQYSEQTRAFLLDFQIYLEKTAGTEVRKYARLIKKPISADKRISLENKLYGLGKTRERLPEIIEKFDSHSHIDLTPDELKLILDIIRSADQTAKLERLFLFVSGVITVMIFVILFLWFKGLI